MKFMENSADINNFILVKAMSKKTTSKEKSREHRIPKNKLRL